VRGREDRPIRVRGLTWLILVICSVKKLANPNANGTPNKAAPASATTNFQNGMLALPAVRNAAAPRHPKLPIGPWSNSGTGVDYGQSGS